MEIKYRHRHSFEPRVVDSRAVMRHTDARYRDVRAEQLARLTRWMLLRCRRQTGRSPRDVKWLIGQPIYRVF